MCGLCGLAPKKCLVKFIRETLVAGKAQLRSSNTLSPFPLMLHDKSTCGVPASVVEVQGRMDHHLEIQGRFSTRAKAWGCCLNVPSCLCALGASSLACVITATCLRALCVPWSGHRQYARWCLLCFNASRRYVCAALHTHEVHDGLVIFLSPLLVFQLSSDVSTSSAHTLGVDKSHHLFVEGSYRHFLFRRVFFVSNVFA